MGKTLGTLSVYKNRPFARFAKKARITDGELWKTAHLANEGVIDADLGGGVIKQRIARANDRAVYVYGFEKKDLANIKPNELEAFRELAHTILGYTTAEIVKRVEDGALFSVKKPEEENNA